MQANKKQLEILLIEYFRTCFSDFPKGMLVPSESPDFIVHFKNHHRLGIELTRLNPANAESISVLQSEQQKSEDNVVSISKTVFESQSAAKLFVKFLFSKKYTIEKQREMALAVRLSSVIRQKVNKMNCNSFFTIHLSRPELPVEIDKVLIINHPGMSMSVWERSNNLGVSVDVVDDIRSSIVKKDEKLRIYQKQRLNYYWLLIFTLIWQKRCKTIILIPGFSMYFFSTLSNQVFFNWFDTF